ncbi:hypothetical protein CcaCcLH18_13179 [Colletotrichum camelliae]|nr:hypothetical protein CcaCcLH18_13179 [Colletotrichum camelliae]
MSSREKRTAELENFSENLRNSDDTSADEIDKETVDRIQAEGDDEPSEDEESREYGGFAGAQKQQRAMKVQRVFTSTRKGCGSSVGDSSESSCVDSSNRNHDGECSSDESDVEITEIENGEDSMDDVKKESSWEVVSDNSSKVEIGNLKRARSQRQDSTSKKHGNLGQRKRNPKKSKNEDQPEQRENNRSKRRRGDADELDSDREESPNGRKRSRRDNEADESPAADNIIQIMKFIRRMALLSDERLMQNLQHGFPLHAQDTILAGFRIIEWFQGTESDLEDL